MKNVHHLFNLVLLLAFTITSHAQNSVKFGEQAPSWSMFVFKRNNTK